jgi:hypothetical protein
LRPINGRLARGGTGTIGELNENAYAALPGGDALLAKAAGRGGDDAATLFARWQAKGDLDALARLHANAVEDKSQHFYMYTEGHWWSDRVEMANDWLQRERLGGIALKRNQTWPGNTVSWRFDQPGAAEQVAILLPNAARDRFRVIAYNTSDHALGATMTAWNVTPGSWTMTVANGAPATVTLERSASVQVTFAPGETVIDFALAKAGDAVETRPDLGIGADDVVLRGRQVTLTVHSLGARATGGGSARLVDAAGHALTTARLPDLAAPADLRPVTTVVRLTVPTGVSPAEVAAEVALPGDAPEITRLNNRVAIAR